MSKSISDRDRMEIQDLLKDGKNVSEILNRYPISKTTVYKWKRQLDSATSIPTFVEVSSHSPQLKRLSFQLSLLSVTLSGEFDLALASKIISYIEAELCSV